MKKFLSSGFFGLTLLCFCLPWVTFSCQQQKITTLTGIQMVTGTQIQEPGSGMFGSQAKMQRINGSPIAIVALVVAAAAFFINFLGGKASIAPAIIGVLTMLALKSNIDQDALKQGSGLINVNYEIGFWGYFITIIAGAITNFFPSNMTSSVTTASHLTTAPTDEKICPMCAETIKSAAIICRHCGHQFEPIDNKTVENSPLVPTSSDIASAATDETVYIECPRCFTKTNEGVNYCNSCGFVYDKPSSKALENGNTQTTHSGSNFIKSTRSKNAKYVAIGLTVFAAIIVVVILNNNGVFKSKSSADATTAPNSNQTQKPAQDNAQPVNIRTVDFKNFRYSVAEYSQEIPKSFKAVKGRYINRGNEFAVGKIIYKDLTGDGAEEAIIKTSLYSTDVQASPFDIFAVLVYSIKNNKAVKLAELSQGVNLARDMDRLTNGQGYIKYIAKDPEISGNNTLSIFVTNNSLGDYRMDYQWNGQQFVLAGGQAVQ